MRQKILILLIKDKPGDAESICLSLRSQTTPVFTVIHETTLKHGIDRLKNETPDIVLLDLDLPDSSGLAALHTFRKADQDTPVVVLVNPDRQEIAAAAIESGAQDYVINTETELSFLPRILRHTLERHGVERKLQASEKALQERDDTLDKIFDLLPVGLWLADKDGLIVRGNPAGAAIWGAERLVKPEEYSIFKAHRLPAGENIEPQDWALARTIRDGITVAEELLEIEAFDGKTKIIVNYSAPIKDKGGSILGAIVLNQDITEAAQAAKVLHDNEASLRALINAVDHSVFLMELDGTVVAINETTARRMGSTVNEMVGKNIYTYINREVAESRRGYADQVIQNRQPIQFIDQRFGRWIDNTIYPVLDEKGVVRRLAIYGQDITERIQAETELRANEERYRIISNVASDYMFYTHVQPDGSLTLDWIAGAFEAITGYTQEEYSATGGWRGHVFADDLEVDNRDLQQLRNHQSVETDIRTVCKDGSILWVQVSAMPVSNEETGALIGIYGSVRDITARKQAEAALRESENKFRALFMNTHTIMFILDPNTLRIIDANPAASAFYGWDLDTLRQKSIPEINTRSPEELLIESQNALAKQRNIFQFKHRLANGELRDVEVFSGPIDYEGQTRLFSIIHDISIRKRMETELRERERELSHLMNNLPGMAYRCIDDDKWTMLFVSQGCDDLTGYPAEALIQNTLHSYQELIHADDRAYVQQEIHAAIREEKIFTLEYRILTADGSEKWVWERGAVIRTPGSATPILEGLIVDITNRKYAEQALQESETRFRHLYEQSPGPYQSLNEKGEFIEVNNAWLAELGYSNDEVIGTWFGDYLAKDQKESFHRNFFALQTTGRSLWRRI